MLAVKRSTGHLQIVKLLLGRDVNVNLQACRYGSPLQSASASASASDYLEVAQLLLHRGATDELTILELALREGRLKTVQLLLKYGAHQSILHQATVTKSNTSCKYAHVCIEKS